MNHLCHDFKSPRNDTSKRLPPIFAVVPIMFYLVLIGGGYTCVTSYMNYRDSTQARDQWKQYQAEQEEAKARFEAEKVAVTQEKWKAEKLAQWVESTRAIQPITVAISRCIPAEITLGEMSLERSVELPQQVTLNVRINSGTLEEVSKIQSAITNLNYRSFNSQQLKSGDALDFRTMLVWHSL